MRLLIERSALAEQLDGRPVLIKPNLVEALQPPITTPAALIEAIVTCLQELVPGVRILIGEGTGAREYRTNRCFSDLGYDRIARKFGIPLVDLNEEELVEKRRPDCRRWPVMYLPKLVYDSYLLSVPVLKAHSLAGVTLTMKNMMGAAPPSHYQRGGHWKKSSFHEDMQAAVLDLNRYRAADFTILDATVGMQLAHLWGPVCDPPPNKLAAGYDPVAIDAFGAGLLGRNWREIGHISDAHGELGSADPLRLEH
ncbi:MAG: DUF362 domain-containing protein, partial [Deltaproteobacteria bacterium]